MKRYIISPGGHPAVLRFEESPVGTWVEAEEAIASRRERIATAALQGILSHPRSCAAPVDSARWAMKCADALIAALDEPEAVLEVVDEDGDVVRSTARGLLEANVDNQEVAAAVRLALDGESAMVGGGASPMKVIRRFNKTEGGGA